MAVSLHGMEYEVRRELAPSALDADRATDSAATRVDADASPIALPVSAVASLVGRSARQLRYLAKTGIVVPGVRRYARGVGAMYGLPDLFALLVVERVRAVCGQQIRIERLRGLLDAFARRTPAAGQYLVTDGTACWIGDALPEATLRRIGWRW